MLTKQQTFKCIGCERKVTTNRKTLIELKLCPACEVGQNPQAATEAVSAELALLSAEQQQRLIEAVRFYAETAKYTHTWNTGDIDHVMEDNGAIAKVALKLAGT